MNPTQVNQETAQAQATGNALQNQYNTQAAQQYGAYTGAQNRATGAYNTLQDYSKYLRGAGSASNLYQQGIQQGEAAQGFDPRSLATATQNLTRTQNALAAGQAASQSATGGYGLSGAQLGNYYATQLNPLAQQGQAQGNAVGNLQQLYQNALTQGQQGTQLALTQQGQISQNYQQAYQGAVSQMATSGSVLAQIEQLQQQQGYLTAQQVSAYRNAYSNYVNSQAAMRSASAAIENAQASMVAARGSSAYNLAQAAAINQGLAAANTARNPAPRASRGLTVGVNNGGMQGGNIRLQ